MAISRIRKKGGTYLIYGYCIGGRHTRIYCGKEGAKSTIQNIKAAKRRHYNDKVENARRMLLDD